MIQRIQSVWLLLAALVTGAIFYFDIFRSADNLVHIKITDSYPSLLFAIVITVLPLITIFMFKNRKRQLLMIYLDILLTISFLGLQLWRVSDYREANPTVAGSCYVGSILPAIAIVLLIMARRAISKDEKLVKSTDRLR